MGLSECRERRGRFAKKGFELFPVRIVWKSGGCWVVVLWLGAEAAFLLSPKTPFICFWGLRRAFSINARRGPGLGFASEGARWVQAPGAGRGLLRRHLPGVSFVVSRPPCVFCGG